MITKEKVVGLCVNCNNRENCSYLVSIKGPIWCCEEYDNYTPNPQPNFSMPLKGNPGEAQACVKPYSSEFKGLCINCENNTTCSAAKLPGGIWHCEEYR